MRKDALCWINIGDAYNSANTGHGEWTGEKAKLGDGEFKKKGMTRKHTPELKSKDLCLIPARVAIALQRDGWWIRHQLPWLKRSQMPGSEKSRPTGSGSAVEYVFLMAKSAKYFYDNEAIKKPQTGTSHSKGTKLHPPIEDAGIGYKDWHKTTPNTVLVGGRERRPSDWFFESWQGLYQEEDDKPLAFIVNPEAFKGAHFATFPCKLIAPMVLAGTSHRVCAECGKPWERIVEKELQDYPKSKRAEPYSHGGKNTCLNVSNSKYYQPQVKTIGFRPACKCNADTMPALVFDPFMGSGTSAVVAKRYGRNYIGIEINPNYIAMAEKRLNAVHPKLELEV